MVEVGADADGEAMALARAPVAAVRGHGRRDVPAGTGGHRDVAVRDDGAGLGGRTPRASRRGRGSRTRRCRRSDSAATCASSGPDGAQHVDGLAYGHFGDGCVHLRLDLPLEQPGDPGTARS